MNEKMAPSPMSAKGTTLENNPPKENLQISHFQLKPTLSQQKWCQEGMDFQATPKRSNMGLHPNPSHPTEGHLGLFAFKKT